MTPKPGVSAYAKKGRAHSGTSLLFVLWPHAAEDYHAFSPQTIRIYHSPGKFSSPLALGMLEVNTGAYTVTSHADHAHNQENALWQKIFLTHDVAGVYTNQLKNVMMFCDCAL